MRLCVPALAVSLVLTDAQTLTAAALTSEEKNLTMLAEAAVGSVSMMNEALQLPFGVTFDYSGTFGPTSWEVTISGSLMALPVDITVSVTFDELSDSGSFTSTGVVADAEWVGTGSWAFADLDPITVSLDFLLEATVTPLGGDRHAARRRTSKTGPQAEG